MKITNLTETSMKFTSNAFLVEPDDGESGRTVLVDAGNDADAFEGVDELDAVVLTHTHPDHVGALDHVVDRFDVDVWAPDESYSKADHRLEDGDTVEMAGEGFTVLETPGHKEEHVCLYGEGSGVLFSGDLVFAGGSFGRTDLPEGDRDVLVDSIRRVLDHTEGKPLEEMHAGHEPSVDGEVRKHLEASLRNAETMM